LLFYASRFGDPDISQHLLGVSAANGNRWTPLYAAAENSPEALARFLKDRGADVSATDGGGQDAAARGGHEWA